jgi:hypothetical protein
MSHASDTGPHPSCASLLLVAARCTPQVARLYLADPDLRPTDFEHRRRWRRPADGHTPTQVVTSSAKLARVLWAAMARMTSRYLAALLASLLLRPARAIHPRLARWLVSGVRRRPVLLAVGKQLLPTPTWPQPLAGLFRWPLAALALYGPTVGIHLYLMASPDGPDEPVALGRTGRALHEVDLEHALPNDASAAGSSSC